MDRSTASFTVVMMVIIAVSRWKYYLKTKTSIRSIREQFSHVSKARLGGASVTAVPKRERSIAAIGSRHRQSLFRMYFNQEFDSQVVRERMKRRRKMRWRERERRSHWFRLLLQRSSSERNKYERSDPISDTGKSQLIIRHTLHIPIIMGFMEYSPMTQCLILHRTWATFVSIVDLFNICEDGWGLPWGT